MSIISKKTNESPDVASLYTFGIEDTKMVVGLGNPGQEYVNNRHNIGFMCLDYLAQSYDSKWQTKKDLVSHLTQLQLGETRLLLIKPQTFMNLSGQAVLQVAHYYKIPPSSIYIVCDEIRRSLGVIESLITENNFGHNGLKSIQNYLNHPLQLIKIGIGPKLPIEMNLSDFVLSNFTTIQKEKLPAILKEVSSLLGELTGDNFIPQKRKIF